MTLEWEGVIYEIPESEPPDSRDVSGLHRLFREPLEAYVAFAGMFTPHTLKIGECRRSEARQLWLLAQGRINNERVRSWTLQSKHRVGLAADMVLVDEQGQAVWEPAVWRELYATAPPSWYGLTTISKELVHLEHASAAQIVDRSAELGVVES